MWFFFSQHFSNLCFLTSNLENGSVIPLIEKVSLFGCIYVHVFMAIQ